MYRRPQRIPRKGILHFEDYKEFKRLVSLPFKGERHAAANPASNKKYGEALDYYKDLNEGSFKTEILRSIVKSDFEVELEPATETSEAVYGPSGSWNRGLHATPSIISVNRGSIPHTYKDPDYDQKKVRDALKMEDIVKAEPDSV